MQATVENPTRSVLVDYKDEYDLIWAPVRTRSCFGCEFLPGQGLDGYGVKIVTHWKIEYNGKVRRIYCTQISNAGSWWFKCDNHKICVS